MKSLDILNPRNYIIVKGANVNNLKNIDVAIPKRKFVVITGLSGSGKTSLAFDTIFAEGYRLYIESLSAYTRQFLGKIEKPNVKYIKGLSPTISIKQHTAIQNPRSTVGSITEIYRYLRILYARIGKIYSPISGKLVTKNGFADVLKYIKSIPKDSKVAICFPLKSKKDFKKILQTELLKGFSRLIINKEIFDIEEFIDLLPTNTYKDKYKNKSIHILVDRFASPSEAITMEGEDDVSVGVDSDLNFRITDSIQTAFFESKGYCVVYNFNAKSPSKIISYFSEVLEEDDIIFEEPSLNFFNYNNPYGSCKKCGGLGKIFAINEEEVIPFKDLSVGGGAIHPWKTINMSKWLDPLIINSKKYREFLKTPYNNLSEKELDLLWNGDNDFRGINAFFDYLEKNARKIQCRMLLLKYKSTVVCSDCKGTKIRKDAHYVKINKKSIIDLLLMPIDKLSLFFKNIKLSDHNAQIVKKIISDITARINYTKKVGLDYLTLSRSANTLSGGEFQRIKLASSLGNTLVGTIYVLDEPTIGLHPRDTSNLIKVILELKKTHNTIIVVEHDDEVMRKADYMIEVGPEAGSNGGNIVFEGTVKKLLSSNKTHTAKYLNRIENLNFLKQSYRKWTKSIIIKKCNANNIKDVNIEIPLGIVTALTGVSGSGKSSMIERIVYPAISDLLYITTNTEKGEYSSIEGDYHALGGIVFVNQSSLTKNSRSNPVTYMKAYDNIRCLFANQPTAIEKKYSPSMFSFNVAGGRCEECTGEGTITIEMQFMADITLKCEYCDGKRFKKDVLEVTYNGKNISDVLEMTIDDALIFFKNYYEITKKIRVLSEVGLGYLKLGQPSTTLSGGEAQRVKLAGYIKNHSADDDNKIYIFDEPTTGLHYVDINKLLKSINRLVDLGNTVIIIEHNLDVIRFADWVIDMGPQGGIKGGKIVFQGTPLELAKEPNNITAKYLKENWKFQES